MQTYLKVKVKTLAAEAQIIRKEEHKAKTSKHYRRAAKRLMRLGVEETKGNFRTLSNIERDLAVKQSQPPEPEQLIKFWGLRDHRTGVLRQEARSTHLAYGYLRGRHYGNMEMDNSVPPDFDRIEAMVKKYGTKEDIEGFAAWKAAAEMYLS